MADPFDDIKDFAQGYMGIDIDNDSELEWRLKKSLQFSRGFIESFIGYPIYGTHQVILDGTGSRFIWLPRFPIISLSSAHYYDEFYEAWTDYDISYFNPNIETGEVEIRISYGEVFPRGFQNIKIIYDHGFSKTDFRFNSVRLVLFEVAGFIHTNPGLMMYQSVDDGFNRQRFADVTVMLSPELLNILSTISKRSAAR